MKLTLYQIDAFAEAVFSGNPAAIVPLERWLADDVMQTIAAENNLSETAFFVATNKGFYIRWFTPVTEVSLCGHATLASAYVIFEHFNYLSNSIVFESKSGDLVVQKDEDWLQMNFPSQSAVKCKTPQAILDAFSEAPLECLKAEDYVVVFNNMDSIFNAKPNLAMLKKLDLRGVIITAKSDQYDFICRCFAPNFGIDEDPVTGSAFTQLIPYWAHALNKKDLLAKQVSKRGGVIKCVNLDGRVQISGRAVEYMQGEINF